MSEHEDQRGGRSAISPKQALTLIVDPSGAVRSIVRTRGPVPPIAPGTPVASVVPGAPRESGRGWDGLLEELRRDPSMQVSFELAVAAPDGGVMLRSLDAFPVPGDDGSLDHAVLRLSAARPVGTLTDPDEETFRFLAESLPQMLWIAEPDGTPHYLSSRWAQFTGLPVERLLGDDRSLIFHPDEFDSVSPRPGPDGPMMLPPFRLLHRDGAYRWVEATITEVRDEAGELVKIVGATYDITQRREETDRRRVVTEQLEVALEVSGLGRFEVDMLTRAVSGDARFDAIIGPCADGRPGPESVDDLVAVVHAEDRAAVLAAATESRRLGEELQMEFRALRRTPDGPELRWLSVVGRVETAGDQSVRMTGVLADVTDRRAEDAARLRSQKREAIGTLAAGIAHDFNNVISAILSNASVAETELRAGVSPATSLSEIKQASRRASDVVQRLLSFAREEPPLRRPFDLGDVTAEACELLRPTLAGVSLALEAPHGAVPAVLGSASQLHQVVVNLVGNAGHAAADGGGHVVVAVDTVQIGALQRRTGGGDQLRGLAPGRYARLQVADDGPGIPADVLSRMFDPFFTTKAAGEGTGLGLAAAQSIVRSHGGEITAENVPSGRGAVLTVVLPAVDPAHRTPPDADDAPATRALRVLFVDDDPDLAKLAARALPLHGCTVTACTDSADAIATLTGAPEAFDALVVDLTLPGPSNGLDVAATALALRPGLPVVISSGLDDPSVRQAAARLGVGAVLPKPVTIAEIVAELHRLADEQPARTD